MYKCSHKLKQKILPETNSKVVVKFILPIVDPCEQVSTYNTGDKAREGLNKYTFDSNKNILWIKEMEKYVDGEEEK